MDLDLFTSAPWSIALEKYAEATGLSVELYDGNAALILTTAPSSPLMALFQEYGVESGLFDQCARRCMAQTTSRPAVIVTGDHGLTVVGTSLVLEGAIVGAAVGGYALAHFSQVRDVQYWAAAAGLPFDRLWNIVRRQSPAPERRLVLHGELLQVLGDALLRENHRTRLYESAAAELRAADTVKDEFLAVLSHELRSPMNAMLGWLRILKTAGTRDPELVGRAVTTIERNIWVQAQIINDLLDVSRILSGKLQLEHENVDFAALVTGCVESLRPSAEGKQIVLRMQMKDHDTQVIGDSARLQQVVANVLGNAIKFTGSGGLITVTVAHEDTSVCVIVDDTGQGIDTELLPFIFERFRQADSSSTRKHGGLGLGLSIVKHLVELHGGTVDVTSGGLGRGARFSIVLPRAAERLRETFGPRAVSPSTDERGTLAALDVLLVEDDPDTRAALELALEEHGSRVRSAASVHEALEAYTARQPDVVVSDIGLPGEDGYVLIRAIRDLEEGRSRRTLAIAMTGFASRQDHEMALRAGFDEHVAKPVQPEDLFERLRVLAKALGASGTT